MIYNVGFSMTIIMSNIYIVVTITIIMSTIYSVGLLLLLLLLSTINIIVIIVIITIIIIIIIIISFFLSLRSPISMISNWVSFLVYSNLFEIKGFVVIAICAWIS
jgi:hypothetical protein